MTAVIFASRGSLAQPASINGPVKKMTRTNKRNIMPLLARKTKLASDVHKYSKTREMRRYEITCRSIHRSPFLLSVEPSPPCRRIVAQPLAGDGLQLFGDLGAIGLLGFRKHVDQIRRIAQQIEGGDGLADFLGVGMSGQDLVEARRGFLRNVTVFQSFADQVLVDFKSLIEQFARAVAYLEFLAVEIDDQLFSFGDQLGSSGDQSE